MSDSTATKIEPKAPGPVPQPELINADVLQVEDTSKDSGYIIPKPTQTNPYIVEKNSALTAGAWGVTPGFVQGHTVGGNYIPADEDHDDEAATEAANTRKLTVSDTKSENK